MEVKNIFDPAVKQEIINRIQQLSATSQPTWGKMNVSQMLAHVQKPIEVAYGTFQPKGSAMLRIIGPLFKSILYNNTPYRQGLPTDKAYIVTDEKDFDTEKQQLLDLVNRFSEDAIVNKPHPVFGKMTKEQWSKATWKHLDHHLRQFGV